MFAHSSQHVLEHFTLLLAMLRDSPWLEELSLWLGLAGDNLPSTHSIPTRAILHALQKLHFHHTPATLIRQFLSFIDLAPNGIAIQFMNAASEPDWVFPTTLPPEISLQAATSLEIVYASGDGLIVETGAKCPVRRTGQRVIRQVQIAFTADLMPA